jgi:2-phosphosulfolactate phosphatase
MTTTNGTRALRACRGALRVLVGAFVNRAALIRRIAQQRPTRLLLVCSGTTDQVALEDALAAGALAEAIAPLYGDGQLSDSAHLVRQVFRQFAADPTAIVAFSRNGRRLLQHPELQEDVPWCLQCDRLDLVGELAPDGAVRLPGG